MVAAAFKPRWQGKPGVRRGATVEINAAEMIQASLRDAISWGGDLSRGLKSTATVQASLREVRVASQILNCSLARDIIWQRLQPSHFSLCHQQFALILNTESLFCQVEVPIQVYNCPADVAVHRISGRRHEFIRGA